MIRPKPMISLSQLLPDAVQKRAISIGAPGTRWLARIDAIAADIGASWQLTLGKPISGGTESLVLPAIRSDGSQAILKIGMPTVCDSANEARILRLADGRGYVTLYEENVEHNAILVERLGRSLAEIGSDSAEKIETICSVLKTAWLPLTEPLDKMMTGAEKARWLADFIEKTWDEMGEPCSKATRNLALDFAEARAAAFDPGNCVLVHGDAHDANTLQVPGSNQFKFVDPDGLFASPACDLAVPMREWGAELLAGDAVALGQERCERIAELTGVDKTAIWQWGFMERVSTGLVLHQINLPEQATEFLEVADLWTNADFSK